MDYKEQYEKALERAKELLNKQGITVGSYPNREAIETIFPELSESEDERIRKRLLWFLANYTGTWDYPETRMACRAWLEKQKENPKFADSILLDCTSDAKCEDRWFKVAESTPADGRTVLAKDNIGNYLLASFAGGEWLVERYDLDDIPIRHTYVVEWCEIPLCQHDVNEIYRKGVKAGIEIANCNEQKEQKPAECITDEEMKQSRDALHDFKVFATDLAKQFNIDHRRDIDWDNFCAGLLTYLERNKPAEWSEEDKKMKQEEKQLLLITLCSTLPYETFVQYEGKEWLVTGYGHGRVSLLPGVFSSVGGLCPLVEEVRPYLRPMSSMTEEELNNFIPLHEHLFENEDTEKIFSDVVDWMNAHHFDYRELISKGLALEAPEGMYKEF